MVGGTLSLERKAPVIQLASSLACPPLLRGPALAIRQALPDTKVVDGVKTRVVALKLYCAVVML